MGAIRIICLARHARSSHLQAHLRARFYLLFGARIEHPAALAKTNSRQSCLLYPSLPFHPNPLHAKCVSLTRARAFVREKQRKVAGACDTRRLLFDGSGLRAFFPRQGVRRAHRAAARPPNPARADETRLRHRERQRRRAPSGALRFFLRNRLSPRRCEPPLCPKPSSSRMTLLYSVLCRSGPFACEPSTSAAST